MATLPDTEATIEMLKGILLWQGTEHPFGTWGAWKDGDPTDQPMPCEHQAVYSINGKLLIPVLERFGFAAQLDERRKYALPVVPAFGFLLATRIFSESVNPQRAVTLRAWPISKTSSGFELEVRTQEVSWGLRTAYLQQTLRRSARHNAIVQTLLDLLHARVNLDTPAMELARRAVEKDPAKGEWSAIFQGTSVPVCGVHFTPGCVHLYWTGRVLDKWEN